MAEHLSDLLGLDCGQDEQTILSYINYLVDLPVQSLQSLESQNLSRISHSLLLLTQDISKRSYKWIGDSASTHTQLKRSLPGFKQHATQLTKVVPDIDADTERLSATFRKGGDLVLHRRQALQLLQNSERLIDVLELPLLLSPQATTNLQSSSTALELYAHARRLHSLYPGSILVSDVLKEAETAIYQIAASLMSTLEAPSLKLAAAVRTLGWLKRLMPDLITGSTGEEALPGLFLVCRLANLITTLGALHPLQKLADDECVGRQKSQHWSGGQQTERYLKRYIEIFREHSFSIVSMSRGIGASLVSPTGISVDKLGSLPSTLSTLPLHLVDMLSTTLKRYLPNVEDQASRESILTQVLYCASSLGRLGADFGIQLALTGLSEWVGIVKRHRLLAGRLDTVIGESRAQVAPWKTSGEP